MRVRHLPIFLLGIALLASACGGKGLGTGTVGQAIGAEYGYNAVPYEPSDRVAPEPWTAQDLAGNAITSASLRGTVTLVNLWAQWCAPCREEQPELVRVAHAFASKGVRFLGVNVRDQKAAALAFAEEFAIPYPSVFDPSSAIAHKLRLGVPPSTLVLDRDGKIAWRIIGIAREAQLTRILNLELSR